eukprot:m.69408 g.69408  ORF g.69408 m.69408 type:complete len:140 (-) comp16779_c0_seq4:127-546(-)
MCRGIDVVLEEYRRVLLALEETLMRDPGTPLSHLQHTLHVFQHVLPALVSVIQIVQEENIKDCTVLELLHTKAQSGIPAVQAAMHNVVYACHNVMYSQLTAWLIYGQLSTASREFFIQANAMVCCFSGTVRECQQKQRE